MHYWLGLVLILAAKSLTAAELPDYVTKALACNNGRMPEAGNDLPSSLDQKDTGLCYAFSSSALAYAAQKRAKAQPTRFDPYYLATAAYQDLFTAANGAGDRSWAPGRTAEEDFIAETKRIHEALRGISKPKGKPEPFERLEEIHRNVKNGKVATPMHGGLPSEVIDLLLTQLNAPSKTKIPGFTDQSEQKYDELVAKIRAAVEGNHYDAVNQVVEVYLTQGAPQKNATEKSDVYSAVHFDFKNYFSRHYDEELSDKSSAPDFDPKLEKICDPKTQRDRFEPRLEFITQNLCRGIPLEAAILTGGTEVSRDGGKTWAKRKLDGHGQHSIVLEEIKNFEGTPNFVFLDSMQTGTNDTRHASLIRFPVAEMCRITGLSVIYGPGDPKAEIPVFEPKAFPIARRPPIIDNRRPTANHVDILKDLNLDRKIDPDVMKKLLEKKP